MDKKIILGIVIVAIIFTGIFGYLILGTKSGTAGGTNVNTLFLESFPAGTQMGPGLTGIQTTTIKIGELVSLSGTITADGAVDSSVKIFDAQNNLVTEQPCVKIKGTGGFGCSLDYPQSAGTYTLKFYIDDTEKRSLEFGVTQ